MSLWLEAFGASTRYYDAKGVRTRVLEAGDGEAVIFLHGIGGHVEAFIKNIVPLSDRYRAMAIDMIGHGLTGKPDRAYMPPDYARHILDLMDAAGIERAHLVGESLGGWAAFYVLDAQPERVLSYTSLVGAGLHLSTFDGHAAPGVQQLRKRSAEASASPTRETIRARLEWLFHEPERFVTDELVETRLRLWSSPDMQRVQPRISDILKPELGGQYYITEDRLRQVTVPTYFMWTEFNPTTPWTAAKHAASLVKGARFDVMPNCGHWPQYEDPDEFHTRIRSFLGSATQGA